MRWGNNENGKGKNKRQILPYKIPIRVKTDKYINTSSDVLLSLINAGQLRLHE